MSKRHIIGIDKVTSKNNNHIDLEEGSLSSGFFMSVELNGTLSQTINHNKKRTVLVRLFDLSGNEFEAQIKEIDADNITIVSNNVLAGKAVLF